MKKKIMALVLAASMITVPFATAYASEKDAAAEKTEESADETKETTESPVAGKKIAYIKYCPLSGSIQNYIPGVSLQ